ncbi:hypothetical protein [uncultured Algibacter sp.]|uniref:hypothetical protein n=1 Tax=uncultured Algibacter sp. TaxID=298659 RepID=UPI0032175F5E
MRPAYNMGCVAYFELNIDYIIETYCINKEKPELKCNGKCHLATQLAKTSQDSSKGNTYLSLIYETFVPVYFQDYKSPDLFLDTSAIMAPNWSYVNLHKTIFFNCFYRPPQHA